MIILLLLPPFFVGVLISLALAFEHLVIRKLREALKNV